jgi:hypothetical protein
MQRHVVEHHRQARGLGDRAKVRFDARLWRPAVIRADGDHARRAQPGRLPRELDRVARVVAAHPGDHRHGHGFAGGADQVAAFPVAQHRGLAGRRGDDQAVAAVLHQPARQPLGGIEIQAARAIEGRDHGGEDGAPVAGARGGRNAHAAC